MEKQHLTYFKIENFKRFDSFEMENLGQFNLIVGDNNVGKTTVLEGLTLEEDRVTLLFYLTLSFLHKNLVLSNWSVVANDLVYQKNFWHNIIPNIKNPLKLSHRFHNAEQKDVSIKFVENKDITEEDISSISKQIPVSKQPELWLRYYKYGEFQGTFGRYGAEFEELIQTDKTYTSKFLRMNVTYNDNHINSYYSVINSSKKRRHIFEEGLRLTLKNLDEIRPHKIFEREILGVVLKNEEKIYPITQFGDGVIKLMRILLSIISCQGNRVMIDEIDTGIHFTRLKDYWKTILRLCSKHKVQLFATTHSLECQQAFIEALEDPEMQQYQKDARNISLIENKQGVVEAITFDFEQFEYAVNIGFNTRGGKA